MLKITKIQTLLSNWSPRWKRESTNRFDASATARASETIAKFQARTLCFFLVMAFSGPAFSVQFLNWAEVESALNAQAWKKLPSQERVKIAVLDKSFYGLEQEIGKSLPADTKYFRGIVKTPEDLKSPHGTVMAQLVTKMADNPQLFLFNCFGYSNLEFAVNQLIKDKVDIVLYSEVWEFGGNRKGDGFINALVDKALDEGIFWVNAAGNFETLSYTSKISTLEEDWVQLPDQNSALKIVCNHPLKKNCPFKAVLSWNDFQDDVKMGTTKDLDLALTDDFLNILETSAQKQTDQNVKVEPGATNYPRETVSRELKNGVYYLRIKNRSKNFDSHDEFFVTVDGEGLSVPSHTQGESLLNPADNPRVLTVGASDSERSSVSVSLHKPDVLTPSSIKTDEGEFRGSSNSAALVAGSLALVKSRRPEMSFEEIVKWARTLGASHLNPWNQGQGLSASLLGIFPANGVCFQPAPIQQALPPHIQQILKAGAIMVETNRGLRLMAPFDPLTLGRGLRRVQYHDMVLTTPQGIQLAPRASGMIPPQWVEVFQQPPEFKVCQEQRAAPKNQKEFRLFNP